MYGVSIGVTSWLGLELEDVGLLWGIRSVFEVSDDPGRGGLVGGASSSSSWYERDGVPVPGLGGFTGGASSSETAEFRERKDGIEGFGSDPWDPEPDPLLLSANALRRPSPVTVPCFLSCSCIGWWMALPFAIMPMPLSTSLRRGVNSASQSETTPSKEGGDTGIPCCWQYPYTAVYS